MFTMIANIINIGVAIMVNKSLKMAETLDITDFHGGQSNPLISVLLGARSCRNGCNFGLKGLKVEGLNRKFSSLEVWQHFRKSRSLEVWKFRPAVKPVTYIGRKACGLEKQTRRLSWDFISTDFITPFNFLTIKPFNPNALAFTMAEILISLTIIGVIAAITLPALRANINEKAWATQRKALYSRMSQAISTLPNLNGYGIGSNNAETNSKATLTFINNGLNSVLKINNICDSTELAKCGISNEIVTMSGLKINFPKRLSELNSTFTSTYTNKNGSYTNPQKDTNTIVAAFETENGESVAVFYNPLCLYSDKSPDLISVNGESQWYSQTIMCANFIFDLNGLKGPNKVGKDIGFITAFYPSDSILVAPVTINKNAKIGNSELMTQTDATKVCTTFEKGSRIPNIHEIIAIFINKQILGIEPWSGAFWSGSATSSSTAWNVGFAGGLMYERAKSIKIYVRCVKR